MSATLSQHVRERHGEDLASLITAIAGAAIRIEATLRTAALGNVLGAFGHTNVQGEQQQKLDVFANETMVDAMRALPSVAGAVSEENDAPIMFDHRPQARYIAIFDPLDGSSNIDVNVNVGTIVSVQPMQAGRTVAQCALQPGTAQVAALYVNYGPSTVLVYTAGNGTHSFTLADGEFRLSGEDLCMPEYGPYYSTNEGNVSDFPAPYPEYLAKLRDGSLLGRRYSSRYVGSFIADFHRTLLKGGVFLYPPTHKTPAGKLRLLYEANPLSFVAEQAAGAATDGTTRILDVVPTGPHQRTPLVIGSRVEVEALLTLAEQSATRK